MGNVASISDIELTGLFAGLERTPLALAVSGGADSVALMHMMARWTARTEVRAKWAESWRQALTQQIDDVAPQRTDWTGLAKPPWLRDIKTTEDLQQIGGTPHVVVLTVNHGLREASAEEVLFVADEAAKLGLPCVVLEWHGEKPSTGIQEAARAARRDLMCDVLRAEQGELADIARAAPLGAGSYLYRRLVMAHHQEDQAETFLMRLARGSGLEGLGCMKPSDWIARGPTAERPSAFRVPVERPFLDVPKARLVATLEAYGAKWVEDPSNEDQRFERVRVRKALAQLGEVGLTAEKIALSAGRLRDAEMGIVRLLHAESAGRATDGATAVRAEVDLINSCDFVSRYTAVRALRRILSAYGGSAREAEMAQVEPLATQTLRPQSRAAIGMLTLGGCKIECHGEFFNWLCVYREGSGEGLPVTRIEPGQTVDWDGGRFEVSADERAPAGAIVRALGMQGWADLKKTVRELAQLKWPAAAAATLPVVERHGSIVAYVGVTEGLRSEMDAPDKVLTAWNSFAAGHEATFWGRFGGVRDL